MSYNNTISPINTSNCPVQTSFKAGNTEPEKSKDYYKYRTKTVFDTTPKIIAGCYAVGALTAGISYGLSQMSKKFFNGKIQTWLIVIASFFAALKIERFFEDLYSVKRLKSLSEEEKVKRGQDIENFIADISKQKGIAINGIHYFEPGSKTALKYADAAFDFQTGGLMLDSRFKDTNLDLGFIKPIILHELIHTRQLRDIARLKDGLYDLNRVFVISAAKSFSEDFKQKITNMDEKDVYQYVKDDMKEYPQEYFITDDDKVIKTTANQLIAVKRYLKNPDISKYDLPLMFDEDYYKKVVEGKPPLTPEEEKRAQSYIEYKEKNVGQPSIDTNPNPAQMKQAMINYANNPMEIEAYAVENEYKKTGKIT